MLPSFGAECRLVKFSVRVSYRLVQTSVSALDEKLTSFAGVDVVPTPGLLHILKAILYGARDANDGDLFRRGRADRKINKIGRESVYFGPVNSRRSKGRVAGLQRPHSGNVNSSLLAAKKFATKKRD